MTVSRISQDVPAHRDTRPASRSSGLSSCRRGSPRGGGGEGGPDGGQGHTPDSAGSRGLRRWGCVSLRGRGRTEVTAGARPHDCPFSTFF